MFGCFLWEGMCVCGGGGGGGAKIVSQLTKHSIIGV